MHLLNFAVLCILCKLGATLNKGNPFEEKTIDAKNYFISRLKVDWFEAWITCRYRGWYLVDVLTEQENNRILSIIKSYNLTESDFWMSSIDLADISHYYWVTNGQFVSYSDWAPDEPTNDNGEEHCVHYWGSSGLKWKVYKCDEPMYFICRDTPDVPMVGVAGTKRKQNKQRKSKLERSSKLGHKSKKGGSSPKNKV